MSTPPDRHKSLSAAALLARANAKVVKLTAELSQAEERQRMHIGAELHDDVQQILVGLRMSMAASRRVRTDSLPAELVQDWTELLQKGIDHLHQLTVVLRKPVINGRELPGALRAHVDQVRTSFSQEIAFETDADIGKVAPNVALACFRIVQEGLANAVKHSTGVHLQVGLKRAKGRLMVSVIDDGVGFDVKDALAQATKVGSVGLSSMQDRAALAGGRFMVESAVGAGTQIVASFPVEKRHLQARAAH